MVGSANPATHCSLKPSVNRKALACGIAHTKELVLNLYLVAIVYFALTDRHEKMHKGEELPRQGYRYEAMDGPSVPF
jgi:hypothetical protein